MKTLIHFLVSALAILITAYILPGAHVDGLVSALVLAVILAAINMFVKPVLLVLTLPITVMTLGLFMFVLNALLIMLAGAIVPGFSVDGFWSALLFSIILVIVNAILGGLKKD